jgi:hypothetical protein
VDCVGCGVGGPLAYYTMKELQSHDFKLGFRYLFSNPEPFIPEPAPLVRKG